MERPVDRDFYGPKIYLGRYCIETLKKSFKQFNFSHDDIYRLAFGGYYHEKDFHRRPLSKMIKDIAIEMEIVNSY